MAHKKIPQTGQPRNTTDEKLKNPMIDGEPERPCAPLYLDYKTRKFYNETIQSLPADWMITADLPLFEIYCITYTQYHRYLDEMNDGEVYEDERGILRAIPQVALAEKARAALITMSGKLRLNPTSRGGVSTAAIQKKAQAEEVKKRTGRRKGLLFSIDGGKDDNHPEA